MMCDWISDIGNFLGGVFSIIPKLLYYIIACLLSLIDLCQVAFRKLAGLDPIMIPSSQDPVKGDTVYRIIVDALFTNQYPAVRTIFWALIILGGFMLLVTSFIAVLRLEYAPDKDKGNSKSGVIKNFFKALFSFAIVPITCLFGMYMAGGLVKIIDTATAHNTVPSTEIATYFDTWTGANSVDPPDSVTQQELLNYSKSSYFAYNVFGLRIPSTSEPFSGIVFKACAYGCNRVRNDSSYFTALQADKCLGIMDKFQNNNLAANILDQGFAMNARLKGTYNLNTGITDHFDASGWITFDGWNTAGLEELSKFNVNAIYYFYNLWSFNFIIAFVAVTTIGKSFYGFVLFLMQRMFEILGLFLVSPVAVSLMPLDNGDALKQWRTAFVTKFALLIIMVLTVNLVTPLVSIGQNIKLFGVDFVDYIITTFFLIASLNAISSLNSMFSKIFTGDEKNWAQVDNAAKGIQSSFTEGLGKTIAAGKLAAAPVTLPARGIGMGIAGIAANARENRARRPFDQQEAQRKADHQNQIAQLNADKAKSQQELDALNRESELFKEFGDTQGSWYTDRLHLSAGRNKMEEFLKTKGYSDEEAKNMAQSMSARAQQVRASNLNPSNGSMNGNMSTLMEQSYKTDANGLSSRVSGYDNQIQSLNSTYEADLARIETQRQQAINNAKVSKLGKAIAKVGNVSAKLLSPYGSSLMSISGFNPYTAPKDQDLTMGGLIGGTVYTLTPYDQRNPYAKNRGKNS